MVYLQILCNLILIFAVFEPSKINYARGIMKNEALLELWWSANLIEEKAYAIHPYKSYHARQ